MGMKASPRRVTLVREDIDNLRAAGWSINDIAEDYGLSYGPVSRFIASGEAEKVVTARRPAPQSSPTPPPPSENKRMLREVRKANERIAPSDSSPFNVGDFAEWLRKHGIAYLKIQVDDDRFTYEVRHVESGQGVLH